MAPRLEAAIEPMPVDVDLFTPSPEPRGSRFLFVGRLNPQKGVGLLLEATAAMRVKAELDIVGDGPARGTLERMARDLGLAGRVAFRGHLPQSELVRLYRSASAVVLPGENEGLGLVAVEAQLCEAPVIALRSGGTPDVVIDGATGFLVAPNDPRALAAAMDSALGRFELVSGYGRAGRAAALARFSPAAVASRYQHVYRQVLTRVA
jgi:glycosyltransferase involved in cell wall biosynthesis